MNDTNLDLLNDSAPGVAESADGSASQDNQVEDIADFYLPCLMAVLSHLDKSMTESALRSRVADPDGGWDWLGMLDSLQSLGLAIRSEICTLALLGSAVEPILVSLKEGGCAVVLPSVEGDESLVLWPMRSPQPQHWSLEALAQASDGHAVAVSPPLRTPVDEAHLQPGRMGHWFWGPLLSAKTVYWQVGIAAFLTNVFALTTSIFSMIVYDRVLPNNAIDTLTALLIGVGFVLISDFVIRTVRGYFLDVAGARSDAMIADSLFEQILDIDLAARKGSVGSLANVLKEYESIREFLTSATLTTLIDIPFALLFLGVIAAIGGPLVWVLVVIIPFMILSSLIVQPKLRKLVQTSFEDGQNKHSVLVETLSGLETVKAVGAGAQMRHRWQKAIAHQAQIGLKTRMLSQFAGNAANLGSQLSSIAIVAYGVYLAHDGSIGTGAIVACSMLSSRAISPLAQLAQLLTRVNQSLASYKALKDLMEQAREHPPNVSFVPRHHLNGDIEFKNVSFRYPGQQSGGLDDISFRIKAGERVAIIGRVGSGKTTLSKLVQGLRVPTSGAVLVDGSDVRQFDKADLRRHMGTVLQEVWLMSGTVRHNIALGAKRPLSEDILWASQVAGVHDFISTHPDGYNLKLAERGEGLSGGQRQAISIARAIIGRPKILLMDEPTSAMDVNAEKLLIDRLKANVKDCTLLVITHKATLLDLVDRVIVMDQGKIVADGPKEVVLKPNAAPASGGAA
jgi:ATP-binding cassette subfamily C protein LapB